MELLLTLSTTIALLVLFVATEVAMSRGMPAESTRRLSHVTGGSAAAAFPLYLQQRDVLILAAMFTGFLLWTWIDHILASVHAVERVTVGALVFPAGLALAALIAWSHPVAFAFGALVLALADTSAGFVGRMHDGAGWRVPGGRKSARGSLAFLGVSFALAMTLSFSSGQPHPAAALVVALLLTGIEGVLGYGLDNLPLPAAAAMLGNALLGL